MGILLGVMANGAQADCDALFDIQMEVLEDVSETNASTIEKLGLVPDTNCFMLPFAVRIISSIAWTLGAIFVIIGFLETKKKK